MMSFKGSRDVSPMLNVNSAVRKHAPGTGSASRYGVVLTGHWYAAHLSGASFAGLAIIVSGHRGAHS